MRWGLGRVPAGVARDRKPFPSRWSRSILACGVWCGRGGVGRSVSGGDVASVRAGSAQWSGLTELAGSAQWADSRGARARAFKSRGTRRERPPHPALQPSIRTHSHTAGRHAPGSRWRRRRSPPLMFAGCCQTASGRPHLRCRRRSAMRRCRARVWACGTRTCCSRGSSRAGRGFLGAAWLPWEVVLRAPSV